MMKKLISIVLCVVLAICLIVSANAAENSSLSIEAVDVSAASTELTIRVQLADPVTDGVFSFYYDAAQLTLLSVESPAPDAAEINGPAGTQGLSAGADLPGLIADAHTAGAAVICSSHDFQKTPPKAELVDRMVRMQQAGADLPKLAVMPRSRTDVLTLLAATAEMADCHPDTPVITMSMGALGAVSRLAGEAFGSAMTFANPGTASAPGQIPLDVVNAALECLKL